MPIVFNMYQKSFPQTNIVEDCIHNKYNKKYQISFSEKNTLKVHHQTYSGKKLYVCRNNKSYLNKKKASNFIITVRLEKNVVCEISINNHFLQKTLYNHFSSINARCYFCVVYVRNHFQRKMYCKILIVNRIVKNCVIICVQTSSIHNVNVRLMLH